MSTNLTDQMLFGARRDASKWEIPVRGECPQPWTCASMKFTRYQWTIVYTYFSRASNCEPMRRWNYSDCDVRKAIANAPTHSHTPFSRYKLNFITRKKSLFLFLLLEIFVEKNRSSNNANEIRWQMKRNGMEHKKQSRYKRIHIFCFFFLLSPKIRFHV